METTQQYKEMVYWYLQQQEPSNVYIEVKKPDTEACTVWFRLYDVLDQLRLIYGEKFRMAVASGGESGNGLRRGKRELSKEVMVVLCVFVGVWVAQVPKLLKHTLKICA